MATAKEKACCKAAKDDPMVPINYHDIKCAWRAAGRCKKCDETFTQYDLMSHDAGCAPCDATCTKCGVKFDSFTLLEQHLRRGCNKEEAEAQQKQHGGDCKEVQADVVKSLYSTDSELERDIQTLTEHQEKQIEHLRLATASLNEQIASLNLRKPSAYDVELLNQIGLDIAVQTRLIYDLEQAIQVHEPPVYNGEFIWTIRNYSQKKHDEISGRVQRQTSCPFYTSPRGHKLCVHAYLNGQGEYAGKGISVFAEILEGEYDDLAPFPLCEDVGFMLLSQRHNLDQQEWVVIKMDPSQVYCHRPPMNEHLSFGNAQFALHQVVETHEYLVDDTIFIKIKVGITTCESDVEENSSEGGGANEVTEKGDNLEATEEQVKATENMPKSLTNLDSGFESDSNMSAADIAKEAMASSADVTKEQDVKSKSGSRAEVTNTNDETPAES